MLWGVYPPFFFKFMVAHENYDLKKSLTEIYWMIMKQREKLSLFVASFIYLNEWNLSTAFSLIFVLL